MLSVTVEEAKDRVILRCRGRIVCGDENLLLCAAVGRGLRSATIDLTEIDAIDQPEAVVAAHQLLDVFKQVLNAAFIDAEL